MSKTDIYSKALYPSIAEGIRAVMKPYGTSDEHEGVFVIYSPKGLEEALAFLCFNNIPHGYAKNKAVITLNWEEEGRSHYMCWFEEEDKKEENTKEDDNEKENKPTKEDNTKVKRKIRRRNDNNNI